MSRFIVLSLGASLLLTSPVFSQQAARIYKSPNLLGRGHSGRAQVDLEDAIYYNPAGLVANHPHKKESKPSPDVPKEDGKPQAPETKTENTSAFGFRRVVYLAPFVEASKDLQKVSTITKKSSSEQITLAQELLGKNIHVGGQNILAVIFNRVAFSALAGLNGDIIIFKDPSKAGIETVSVDLLQSMAGTGSYAHSIITDRLTVGTTVKYIKQTRRQLEVSLDQIEKLKKFDYKSKSNGAGIAVDLAVQASLPVILKPKFSLTVENFGDTKMKGSGDPGVAPVDNLLQTINFGFGLEYDTRFGKLEGTIDRRDLLARTESNGYKKTHLGLQYSWNDWIGITGGLNQGYKTAGFFLNSRFARLDLGTYTEEMGNKVGLSPDQRYFVRITGSF